MCELDLHLSDATLQWCVWVLWRLYFCSKFGAWVASVCFWRCGSAETGLGKTQSAGSISGGVYNLPTAPHLWVQLSSAFINGLLSSQAIDDLGIVQFSQSLVLQPLPLLPFGLRTGDITPWRDTSRNTSRTHFVSITVSYMIRAIFLKFCFLLRVYILAVYHCTDTSEKNILRKVYIFLSDIWDISITNIFFVIFRFFSVSWTAAVKRANGYGDKLVTKEVKSKWKMSKLKSNYSLLFHIVNSATRHELEIFLQKINEIKKYFKKTTCEF